MPDVFLLAHQDDEYGVFHAIAQSAATGRRPLCLYLTSGDFGGQDVARRNRESRDVLAALGVAAADVHFIGQQAGISDGVLLDSLEPAYQAVLALLQSQGAVTALYVLAYEGGHQDHDAVYLIGCRLQKALGIATAWQFSLYQGKGLPSPLFRVLAPLPENGAVQAQAVPWTKRWWYLRLCLRYRSQLKTWVGLFPFVLLYYLRDGRQQLQPLVAGRCRERPHAGPLLYEKRGVLAREVFESRSKDFLDAL
ncbi:MAG TPA: PIG-L family deacetylase [Moraxellaceae bacterium]